MEFIEYKIRDSSTPHDGVKICFSIHNKRRVIVIRIGNILANKIGIKIGDRVSFSYDDHNKRIWIIKKTKDGNGYRVGGNPNERSCNIQITFNENMLFKIEENEKNIGRIVKIEPYEDGIKIDASLEGTL